MAKVIKNKFKKLWLRSMIKMLYLVHPNLDEEKTKQFLKDLYQENLNDEDVCIENNYRNTTEYMSLTEFIDWCFIKKPITTEYGVMFKQHSEEQSVVNIIVDFILKTRSVFKSKMKEYIGKDPDKVLFYDLRQKVMKIFANSIYGVLGNKMFVLYNIFNAEAITKKGQNMITNCYYAFEEFLHSNIKFITEYDFVRYVDNITSEEYEFEIDDIIDIRVNKQMLKKKMISKFYNPKKACNIEIVRTVVKNLTDDEVQKVYYKNSFIEFIRNKKITKLWKKVLVNDVVFRNPNEVPEELSDNLTKIWNYCHCFVFYKHMIPETRNKFKKYGRKAVILVDTDSNMINLNPFYEFLCEHLNLSLDDLETQYKIINALSYVVVEMVNEYLDYFSASSGIQDEKYWKLKMKNEFFMGLMLLTKGKKNYVALMLLQEGKELLEKDQVLLKGISIKKTTVNKNTANFLSHVLEHRILRKKQFSSKDVLNDLEELADNIRHSFELGEKTYMTPSTCKGVERYDFPYRIAQLRGALVWNMLYPKKEITFPTQLNTVKLDCDTLDKLDVIKKDYPKEYAIIKEVVFGNPEMAHYGFVIFSMPKSENFIPEFIRSLVDVDTIVTDNLKNFLPLSEAIGINSIYSKKDTKFISNIVNF